MSKKEDKNLVKKAKTMMRSKKLTEALSAAIEEQRGSLGFLLTMLKRRHRTFNPYILKGMSVYREPLSLDSKTVELAAVSAATALRCEHCLEAHIRRALEEGATEEEILDVILIAGAISESSTLSVALRKFKQQEGRLRGKDQKK